MSRAWISDRGSIEGTHVRAAAAAAAAATAAAAAATAAAAAATAASPFICGGDGGGGWLGVAGIDRPPRDSLVYDEIAAICSGNRETLVEVPI